ncbi:VOC family protein [Solirubrobacter sp. CPCC 204708]|uniref:VOC family protein n=1 Tax=Solirubrobacter deserti TaxID=2282478 RepID=A0ABT4RCW7_9ACTN|nr:VOC family protein [Solirubrobacter deserti]MBE2317849.1 VOC family protein [Solirubrobacter deserti]MDA0136374.1 VOC family protein [Solirubrobacter deserti]
MGDRTSYAPGTVSWAELVTSDAEAAKGFYTDLFGWTYDDRPVGEDMVYSMAQLEGKSVAALYRADEHPHWNCYVTVESVEDTCARVADLGGSVIGDPFDVMTAGRSAVISDPSGAVFFLWEPGDNIGAYYVNAPGAMAWNDLVTPDPDAAAAFYGALFGWTFQEIPGAQGYRSIQNGEAKNGGVFPMEGARPGWIPYFGHEDVDGVVARVDELGVRIVAGPIEVPGGKFAILTDPQGAAFGVLQSDDYDD